MRGTLVLVVGPSGAGKDSLIGYCRDRIPSDMAVAFPQRLITRPRGSSGEDHHPISEAEFEAMRLAGALALHWRAHGLSYGLPSEIDDLLETGRTVIANVSRGVIEEARARYRPLKVIEIMADAEARRLRLQGRGREMDQDIRERLNRAAAMAVNGTDVIRIDNSGALQLAGEGMLRAIMALAPEASAGGSR